MGDAMKRALNGVAAAVLTMGLAVMCAGAAHARKPVKKASPIRVLVWSERTEPANIYPDGINGVIAAALRKDPRLQVRTAQLDDPDAGVSEATLDQTDVLIWFGHKRHDQVPDDAVERIVRHVREKGMGFLPVHSSHSSKPFKALMQSLQSNDKVGSWRDYTEDGKPTRIIVVDARNPIARGVTDFTIPKTERYDEPFQVPGPFATVFDGVYADGLHARQGMTWNVGAGKGFYWRPGHESFPIFFMPQVQKILDNGVHWLAGR